MSYTPAAGTLPHRVCAYFVKHPEEKLSAADIALKFDVDANGIPANLATAMTHKLVERVRGAYRGGPNLHKQALDTDSSSSSAAPAPLAAFPRPAFPATPRATRKRARLPVLDVSALPIEADVPLPPARSGGRSTDWPVLFERLTKAGLCSSPLPIEQKHSLKNAADKWFKAHGGTFAIRTISDTHLRIWRTA
jgi:hypothetical protein